jgi:glycosyltransferase involved in cell wall biosynthesis
VSADQPAVVVLYRDAALRRRALETPPGSPERYCLHGLDELQAAGALVTHTLEPDAAPNALERIAGRALNALVTRTGGYGGAFAAVLGVRRRIAAADAVFSTVDTLGIPLVLLRQARLVARTPVVYASIGLLDRMARLRSARALRRHRSAFDDVDLVLAYGHAEAEELRAWLAPLERPPVVRFVPFGVDTDAFAPVDVPPDLDVVAIGADPRRDWALLQRVAARTPTLAYRAIAAHEQRSALVSPPVNVEVELGLPLEDVRERLQRARIVALPVVDNAYSGATTTLLQAMACGRPVVVSRTRAIADGYGLVDGENCILVPPGDEDAFAGAISGLAAEPERAAALGARARAHVVAELGWARYTAAIVDAVLSAARGQTAA